MPKAACKKAPPKGALNRAAWWQTTSKQLSQQQLQGLQLSRSNELEEGSLKQLSFKTSFSFSNFRQTSFQPQSLRQHSLKKDSLQPDSLQQTSFQADSFRHKTFSSNSFSSNSFTSNSLSFDCLKRQASTTEFLKPQAPPLPPELHQLERRSFENLASSFQLRTAHSCFRRSFSPLWRPALDFWPPRGSAKRQLLPCSLTCLSLSFLLTRGSSFRACETKGSVPSLAIFVFVFFMLENRTEERKTNKMEKAKKPYKNRFFWRWSSKNVKNPKNGFLAKIG